MLPSLASALLRTAALASILATASADDSTCHHKPGERFRVRVVPDAGVFHPGSAVRAKLEIEALGAAAAFRVVTRGEGALAAPERVTDLGGPWPGGARAELELGTTPIGGRAGSAGELRVRVLALDDFGATIQERSTVLHALVDGQGTWVSGSSTVDLALRRLDRLHGTGAIDAREHAEARRTVSRGPAATDRLERAPRPLTPAEARLEEAFPTVNRTDRTGGPWGPGGQGNRAVTVVVGKVQWTDRAGGSHGLPMAAVEVRQGGIVLGSTSTNAGGDYAVVLASDEQVTATVRVYARSMVGDVTPDADGAATYHVDSAATNVPGGGVATVNLSIGNGSAAGNAFGVHAALVLIGGYTSTLTGSLPSQIGVRYPTTEQSSFFSGVDRELHILMGDRYDWDVIHHEYGHYVMNVHGFVMSPGGPHSFNTNMAAQPNRDKDSGTRLAWGEGWPTFFGLAGQERMGGTSLGVPGVGDTIYTDLEDANIRFDVETSPGVGEDDEVSVMSCLWDLYDTAADGRDRFSRSDATLFHAFANDGAVRMGDAWNAVAVPLSIRDRTEAGAVLAQASIAPGLTTPPDRYKPGPMPPVFRWRPNGGGMPNPLNDFKIVFYDREFDDKILEVEVGNRTSFVPTQAQGTPCARGTRSSTGWSRARTPRRPRPRAATSAATGARPGASAGSASPSSSTTRRA